MKKVVLGILIVATVLAVSGVAAASMIIPANDNAAKKNAKAPEKSPVIGENWDLERVDFIHYARPVNPGKTKTETCYKLLGVKWNSLPVSYVINPTNSGLPETSVTTAISKSVETWDEATSKELFNNASTVDYSAQYGVQNFKNAIDFNDYPDSNVIAVTSIWYTRVGKQIVEFDIRFNTDFIWGDATVNPAVMDLQNIAVHELGHGVGLGDIYSTTCSAVTMYGYSANGDVEKRTLEQPDITGLRKMYGL